MNVKDQIVEEIVDQIRVVHKMEVGSGAYKIAVDGISKLADKVINIQKLELEESQRNADREMSKYFETKKLELEESQRNADREMSKYFETKKLELEESQRNADREMSTYFETKKLEQAEKDRRSLNKREIFKVVTPLSVAVLMGVFSMLWEKSDSLTTTFGRQNLRDLIRIR